MTSGRSSNHFDVMRCLAALIVVASHAFLLTDGSYGAEPVFLLSHGQTTDGGLAVLVFFVMSGFLITQSFLRTPDPVRFMAARLLRILPGLGVAVLLTAFVLGPIWSTLPVDAYVAGGRAVGYVIGNVSFMQPTDTLPGLFTANPFPLAVNGSLWTLRFEAACYVLVLGLGVTGMLDRRSLTIVFAAALVGLVWGGKAHSGLEFAADFLAGAVYCVWQPRRHPAIILACSAVCAASLYGGQVPLIGATAGAVVILHAATSPGQHARWLTRYGDLSYGIYIYAFPIQQIVAGYCGSLGWAVNLAVSVPPILLCAAGSWHFIERPALHYRSSVHARRKQAPELTQRPLPGARIQQSHAKASQPE